MRQLPLRHGAALTAALLSACAIGGGDPAQPPTAQSANTVVTTAPGSAGQSATGPCVPGPDKRITTIDDVVIPAVDAPEVRVDDVTLGGHTIPGFVVPGVHIPEQRIDTGCLVHHDAPGGCLGAVEIVSDIAIPSIEIPGFEIPGVDAGGVHLDRVTVPAQRITGGRARGARADQVCQRRPDDRGGYIDSVYRDSIFRDSAYRDSVYRDTVYRDRICIDGSCADAITVPALTVPSVSVDSASIDSGHIDSQTLPGTSAEIYQQDTQTAYLAPADVLFDFDFADLRPDSLPTLRAIATDITAKLPGAAVSVEGHTDDLGDDPYNQRLSEARARSVATWLAAEGGIDNDSLTTTGHGETLPAVPNHHADGSDDPAGRAVNRRVVITARPTIDADRSGR
jgi:outer membrane protein OmpA-like peptidoglycan-associated protein